MPTAPKPTGTAVMRILETYKEGFDPSVGRWMGTQFRPNAEGVMTLMRVKKLDAQVFMNSTKIWHEGKYQDVTYYKVFYTHPKDKDLYTWWAPEKDEVWDLPTKIDEVTWFEYDRPKVETTETTK